MFRGKLSRISPETEQALNAARAEVELALERYWRHVGEPKSDVFEFPLGGALDYRGVGLPELTDDVPVWDFPDLAAAFDLP